MESKSWQISQAFHIILTWVDPRDTLRNSVPSFFTSEGRQRHECILSVFKGNQNANKYKVTVLPSSAPGTEGSENLSS